MDYETRKIVRFYDGGETYWLSAASLQEALDVFVKHYCDIQDLIDMDWLDVDVLDDDDMLEVEGVELRCAFWAIDPDFFCSTVW